MPNFFFLEKIQHISCMIFQEKYFSCYILLTDQIHCLIAFTSRHTGLFGNINFEINLSVVMKLFSYMTKKVWTKI